MIPEELVRKPWAACGYTPQSEPASVNENALVTFSDKDMSVELEKICGKDVRKSFENKEYDGNEPFPSDNEEAGSEDDVMEEVLFFPSNDKEASSGNDVEEVYDDEEQDGVCAVGKHCSMKSVPLDNTHHCMNCAKPFHGAVCGVLWAERGNDCRMSMDKLTPWAKGIIGSIGALICGLCIERCSN